MLPRGGAAPAAPPAASSAAEESTAATAREETEAERPVEGGGSRSSWLGSGCGGGGGSSSGSGWRGCGRLGGRRGSGGGRGGSRDIGERSSGDRRRKRGRSWLGRSGILAFHFGGNNEHGSGSTVEGLRSSLPSRWVSRVVVVVTLAGDVGVLWESVELVLRDDRRTGGWMEEASAVAARKSLVAMPAAGLLARHEAERRSTVSRGGERRHLPGQSQSGGHDLPSEAMLYCFLLLLH